MSEGFVVARSHSHIEILCNRSEIFFRRSGEVPMKELFVGVVAGVGAAVAAKNFRSVVGGIEADADEMSLMVGEDIFEEFIGEDGSVRWSSK